MHRAELEAVERQAADAGPRRAVEHRAARGQLDRERDRHQQRRQQRDQDGGADEVEGALDGEVDALEDRRLEREQRQRLAGHELGPLHEDLHRRRRDVHVDAAAMAGVDQLDRLLLREVGVGDDHLLHAVALQHGGEVGEVAERAQAVVGARRQRDVADEVHLAPVAAAERMRDLVDVLAAADEQRAARVAGLPQQPAGHLGVDPAEARDVDDPEAERGVEDVVAAELLAAEDGVDQRHDRDLEERGDDPCEAGAARAVGIEVRAREQQDRQQVGEGEEVARLPRGEVDGGREVVVALDQRLQQQRGEEREPDAGEVERQQRGDPHQLAQRHEPQQERQGRRALAAHVSVGQRRDCCRGPLRLLLVDVQCAVCHSLHDLLHCNGPEPRRFRSSVAAIVRPSLRRAPRRRSRRSCA